MGLYHTYDLALEGSLYIGIVLSAILYGIYLMIFGLSYYFLKKNTKVTSFQRRFYNTYGTALLILNTIAMATLALVGQMMWIVHRDDPGGPAGYYATTFWTNWFSMFGLCSQTAANILADALLIYRCYIIFGSQFWPVAFPLLCLLAFAVTSIMNNVMDADPSISQWKRVVFGAVPVSLTTAVNIIVTTMICARLLLTYRRVHKVLRPELSATYTGVAAILVESAAPFAILGIISCATNLTQSPSVGTVTQVWAMFGGISPQMIILRVAMGTAWNKETLSELTPGPMSFATMHIETNGAAQASIVSQPNGPSASLIHSSDWFGSQNMPVTLNEVAVRDSRANDTNSESDKSRVL